MRNSDTYRNCDDNADKYTDGDANEDTDEYTDGDAYRDSYGNTNRNTVGIADMYTDSVYWRYLGDRPDTDGPVIQRRHGEHMCRSKHMQYDRWNVSL